MICGIYAIWAPSGRCYIGSSMHVRKRWWGHKRSLARGVHHCFALQAAARKYGIDHLEFLIVELCTVDALIEREQYHIDAIGRAHLYNSTMTAGSLRGFVMPDAAKAKISVANKGQRRTAETKARMAVYARNRTPEHLAKLADSQRGKRASAETREKQAATKRGRKQTPEHVANVKAANQGVLRVDNVSGVRGVSWENGKWVARKRINGRYRNLGRFFTVDEAELAIREIAS